MQIAAARYWKRAAASSSASSIGYDWDKIKVARLLDLGHVPLKYSLISRRQSPLAPCIRVETSMRPPTLPGGKISRFFGECITADQPSSIDEHRQPSRSKSAQSLASHRGKPKLVRSKRHHLESQSAQIPPPILRPLVIIAHQGAKSAPLSQFPLDAVKERSNLATEDVKPSPYQQQLTLPPRTSSSSSSSLSLPSLYTSSIAQSSVSTLTTPHTASMRHSSSFIPAVNAFPCRRIDMCKWSLLDETVSKYEEHKNVVGRRCRVWKSRRVTVNSQLNDGDVNVVEPQACLHSFKGPDMHGKETERLILTGDSFAAVVESSKEYRGGAWVIKVKGTVLGAKDDASKRGVTDASDGDRNGEWLLQFVQLERMQVWLKHLKVGASSCMSHWGAHTTCSTPSQTLIMRLKEIEYAFRKGHSSFRPMAPMSLRAREKARAVSRLDNRYEGEDDVIHDLSSHQSDSVEELANSTDSLHFKSQLPHRGLASSRQGVIRESRSHDVLTTTKENWQNSVVSSPSPYNDKLKAKGNKIVKRLSISSIRSHSSSRTSAPLQLTPIPTTPVQLQRRSQSPSSSYYSYASSPRSSRNEEEYQQPWDSPLSSSQSPPWQSSLLSSPATSDDTRSSISSQSSPKSILYKTTHFNRFKRKEVTLKLEAESLRPAISSKLSIDPATLDSPTDPDAEDTTSVFLHPGNDSSLGFSFLKTKSKLVPYQPNVRSFSYDSEIGVAL
jgi:hypothetical protein